MIELEILKHLLIKSNYNKYIRFINIDKELKILYEVLERLHSSLDRDISFTEYKLSCLQEDAGLSTQLDLIESTDVSVEVVEQIVKKHCERKWAHDVALLAIGVTEGRTSVSELHEMYESHTSIVDALDERGLFLTDSFEELYAATDRKGGLQWRLPWLNNTIGGLHLGDFGFTFARTNSGKSTFIASEVSFMLTQLEKPAVMFFNEEAAARMKCRVIQAYFGVEEEKLRSNMKWAESKFLSQTKGLFKFYDRPMLHKREIEAVCKDLEPGLIVIDNIDKIHGFKADREDLKLGQIYTWGRELAKQHSPVIAVCQAGATAENKKWLQHTDIKDAHTSKSSETDFIIGIGKTFDVGMEEIRYLRLVKNKFKAGEHRLECRILPNVARYEEL